MTIDQLIALLQAEEDLAALESRRLQRDEIARIFRVPTRMLGTVHTSTELLEDSMFDMRAYIRNAMSKAFAKAIHNQMLYGTGVKRPTGLLGTSPVASAYNAWQKIYGGKRMTFSDEFMAGKRAYRDRIDITEGEGKSTSPNRWKAGWRAAATFFGEAEEVVQEGWAAVSFKRQNAWRNMPTKTLKQAIAAERSHLLALGLRVTIRNPKGIHTADCDPRQMKPARAPKKTTWYNRKTDVLWHYKDAGDRYEVDWRWTISITNASSHDAILQYLRGRK